jgi:hypothetical protein
MTQLRGDNDCLIAERHPPARVERQRDIRIEPPTDEQAGVHGL